MAKRQKLFTIEESIADALERQIGTGYRSGFVERAIRDRLEETKTPENVNLRWLLLQLLLNDECPMEMKCLARWHIWGDSAHRGKDGQLTGTVFDPMHLQVFKA